MGRVLFLLFKQLDTKSTSIPQTYFNLLFNRALSYTNKVPRDGLFSRIILIGSPNADVAPILDQWVNEGSKVRTVQLQSIIRALRARNRFNQALEVSEWMSSRRVCPFFPGDHAVQLDLIGKVRGIDAAESYFEKMTEKSEKIYGALLSCYIRELLVDKSLSLFSKMKEMGFATNALTYSDIMSLYLYMEQPEKIPDVLSDMRANGVLPNNFIYRICLKSYGLRSDFESIEKLMKEVESQVHIPIHWSVYSTAASIYSKAGFTEKAQHYLKKAEGMINKDPHGYNTLITIYASRGDKSQVKRLWGMKKTASGRQLNNNDYKTMMISLIKLDEFEEAKELFKEWESAGTLYDFRIPNVLLIEYTRGGLVREAEAFLDKIIEKGRSPIPNSWGIIASGYVDQGNMEKALQCMRKAFELQPQHEGWLPKPRVVTSILNWLGEKGEVEQVEEFVNDLRRIVPMDRAMYHALIKAHVRDGNEVDGILQDMKADNIDVDEETKKILGLI
ncbi:hypothetical protein Dimus_018988 [Dionaea muscipula]